MINISAYTSKEFKNVDWLQIKLDPGEFSNDVPQDAASPFSPPGCFLLCRLHSQAGPLPVVYVPTVESTQGGRSGKRILVQYFRKSPGVGSHWAGKVMCMPSLGMHRTLMS